MVVSGRSSFFNGRAPFAALLLLSALSVPLAAQDARPLEPFFPGGTYDASVPTPESVLGYAIGERHTDYAGLERWLDALRASDRLAIPKYGESFEKRPLYLIFISSPANIGRLDAIQKDMARLANPVAEWSHTIIETFFDLIRSKYPTEPKAIQGSPFASITRSGSMAL